MADFYAPQNPGLAAFIQLYLAWRERQANESRLADLMLPKAIPDYLAGLAYGTNPREPPLTSWQSTLAYGLPAVEALGIAPALRPAARGGLAAYGALERRLIPPAGQLNMMAGPGARVEFLNQADPAVRAMITDQLKLQGLRDVQITDGVIRDEIARRNAVTMMGLPAENTAADRAAALGFDTPAYHASDADFEFFDNSKLGTATARNTNEERAQRSAKRGHWFSDRDLTNEDPRGYMFGDISYPVLLKSPKKINDKEFHSTSYIAKDPATIRSRFAAFDPARAKEADILAGIAGLSLIPALTLQDYFRQGQ